MYYNRFAQRTYAHFLELRIYPHIYCLKQVWEIIYSLHFKSARQNNSRAKNDIDERNRQLTELQLNSAQRAIFHPHEMKHFVTINKWLEKSYFISRNPWSPSTEGAIDVHEANQKFHILVF